MFKSMNQDTYVLLFLISRVVTRPDQTRLAVVINLYSLLSPVPAPLPGRVNRNTITEIGRQQELPHTQQSYSVYCMCCPGKKVGLASVNTATSAVRSAGPDKASQAPQMGVAYKLNSLEGKRREPKNGFV